MIKIKKLNYIIEMDKNTEASTHLPAVEKTSWSAVYVTKDNDLCYTSIVQQAHID